jgi:AcrR family transcriptional regulator
MPASARTAPSRRERVRAATIAEITAIARDRLVASGRGAVTLRAIARDMGVTPAALYRYVPSVDGIVNAIVADVRREARNAVRKARDAADLGDPLAQLSAVARALRRWVLAHPAEFALAFEWPGVGAERLSPACLDEFVTAVRQQWRRHPFEVAHQVGAGLEPGLLAAAERLGTDLPPQVLQVALTAYLRVWGLVVLEAAGHLPVPAEHGEALFESELAAILARL